MTKEQAATLRAGDMIITKDGQPILIRERGNPCPDSITYYDNGGNKHAFVTDAWVVASTRETTYTFSIEAGVWHAILDGEMIKATFNSKGAAEAGIEVERRRRAARPDPSCTVCGGRGRYDDGDCWVRCTCASKSIKQNGSGTICSS